MTDYQKLATIIFKILGITLLSFGIIAVVAGIVFLIFIIGVTGFRNIDRIDFSWLFPILTGLFLIYRSNRLAIWVCKGLDKNE